MIIKNRQIILTGFFVILICLVIFSYFYSTRNPNVDFVSILAGSATFVIALLTLSYVYITSRQLDVMIQQLEENKKDRELQNQPLPWITELKICIEKPRFFFSPPESEYSAQPRYWVYFKLKNAGAFPAVTVDVSGFISIPRDGKVIECHSASTRIETLEEKQTYPAEDDKKESFMFADDNSGELIRALREKELEKFPQLRIEILYRNILGGCFIINSRYMIYPKNEEQDSILSNWLSEMASFKIKFKNEIDSLKSTTESNRQQWDKKLFAKVRDEFNSSLLGEDGLDKNELSPWPIPGSFKIAAISNEEYKEAGKNTYYGIRIPP